MSYPRCSFQSVINLVLSNSGQLPAELSAAQIEQLKSFIKKRACDWGWVAWPWPGIVLTEQRQYRQNYNPSTAYAAPTATSASEVYDPPSKQYYQALTATTGNPPTLLVNGAYVVNAAFWAVCGGPYTGPDWVTGTLYTVGYQVRDPADGLYKQCFVQHTSGGSLDPTKFGILTVFDPVIAFNQSWQANTIGDFLDIYLDNPLLYKRPRRVTPTIDGTGAHVLSLQQSRWSRVMGWDELVPTLVWIRFRLPKPNFYGPVLDLTKTYTAGVDTVYFSGTTLDLEGDFWACAVNTTAGDTPANAPTKWTRIPFPSVIQSAVARRAGADWQRFNGNIEKARSEDADADDELYQAQIEAGSGQGQIMKWRRSA